MALNTRRSFLIGLSSLIAAPAIVQPTSIMRIKPAVWPYMTKADYADLIHRRMREAYALMRRAMEDCLYDNTFPALPSTAFAFDETWELREQAEAITWNIS